jgi:GDPmannose 4,6-dehydratase
VDEKAVVRKVCGDAAPAVKPGDVLVSVDPAYFRPAEVETLLGDATRAKEELGWIPEITLQEMVKSMVAADLATARQHALLKQHGYRIAVGKEN